MANARSISWQTRKNWMIDAAVFLGGLLAVLTGLYFLYLPSGGYQGGRNPLYGVTILFSRQTWSDTHTWGGVLMILAVVIHFAIHWDWAKRMGRRMVRALRGRGTKFSRGAKVNLVIDLIIALGFLVTALSGIYLLFLPTGYQGGQTAGWDPNFLFSRVTWDLMHTWAGVIMTVAVTLHFVIHWRWVVNVTRRFFQLPGQARRAAV
jgi:cytochrome b subunit of formate dehydrogenase